MSQPLWKPSTQRVEEANLTRFLQELGAYHSPPVHDYQSLYRCSLQDPAPFWASVWKFCGVVASRQAGTVVENLDRMPGARWFPEARLNFAENLLRHRDQHPALVFWNELGRQRELSYGDLFRQVAPLAARLRDWGVGPGDRVAGYLPNLPETVIAMLAATSVGAVWTSCSPDFGLGAVLDRFGQVRPRVLFAATSYRYGGKRFDYLDRVRRVTAGVDSIEKTVLIPYLEKPAAETGEVHWENCLATPAGDIVFEQLPFDHPVYILYSSGTTGKPKCIVHGAGGTLLQHLKEHVLHTDLKRSDVMAYFTTCGWMMWNWLVSGLATGATLVLYDGAPLAPGTAALLDLAEKESVTIFGTSARYIAAIEKAGVEPARTHKLPALRTILSTGSPLAPASFDYVYRSVKSDVCLSSVSGGTDIVSCFALGNPIGPVWRGELQTRGLGMRVEVFDEGGKPVRGRKGELVCTAPFPSMPVGFWNDSDGEKYRAAYFERFPGVWHHGDYAELTEHDGIIIHGRSDAVLNPGGVRIGTAEIYRIVEHFDEVSEALVVGQDWEGDVRVVLFVRMKPDAVLDEALAERIRRQVRQDASPRHVPAKIIAIADIPRTMNGKISELAVREVIHGRQVRNTDALANPEALDFYRDLPELR